MTHIGGCNGLRLHNINITNCIRLIIHNEEDYDNRLSILKLSELDIHLQILCFHFVSKVQFNEDHQCHKYLTKQQSFNRTTLLDNNVFHEFT